MGCGDAFSAGFLHALRLFPGDDQRVLDYSLATAALKNTIAGDFNLSTEEEIMEVMNDGYHLHDIKIYE
jgi:2-dehydro-3-deoxygluconokinase